jgi:tetratricopeptide (TPR) repeat protein
MWSSSSASSKTRADQMAAHAVKQWRSDTPTILTDLESAAAEYEREGTRSKAIQMRAYAALWLAQHREWDRCLALYAECVRDAELTAANDAALLAKLYQQYGVACNGAARVDLALELLLKALPLLPHSDLAGRATVHVNLGSLYSPQRRTNAANYAACVRHFADAVRLYEEKKDVDMHIKIGVLLATEHAAAGHLDRSNAAWDQVLQACEPLTTRIEEWEAYFGLFKNYAKMGGDAHARLAHSSLADALATAEALGDARAIHATCLALGKHLIDTGHPTEAMNVAKKAAAAARSPAEAVPALLLVGYVERAADPPAAKKTFETARSTAAAAGLVGEELSALRCLAQWHADNDTPDMATQFYTTLLRKAVAANDQPHRGGALLELGILQTKLNDVDGAIEALEQAQAVFERMPGAELQLLETYTHLVRALQHADHKAKADDALARAVALARVLSARGIVPEEMVKDLIQENKQE